MRDEPNYVIRWEEEPDRVGLFILVLVVAAILGMVVNVLQRKRF